jgi:hypothetical protein
MIPEPLTDQERSTLPPIRARWVAHLAGVVGAAVGVAEITGVPKVLPAVDRMAPDGGVSLLVAIPALILVTAGPWLALSPVLLRLGFDWAHILVMALIPLTVPFVLWGVGFRLLRRPYRDWHPSKAQRPTVRPISGTGYHVLQSDLDRYLGSEGRVPVA